MKIKGLVCVLFIFISLHLSSQTIEDSIYCHGTITRFHISPFGIGSENAIGKNATIIWDIGINFSFMITKINHTNTPKFPIYQYFSIEPRIYTNLKERKEKGKRIDGLSGAYGSFRLKGGLAVLSDAWYIQTGPLVGFQRSLWGEAYFSMGIGVGSTIYGGPTRYDEKNFKFGLIGDFKFGLYFSKTQSKSLQTQ